MSIVYLNGKFLPITEAKISVLDRGFLFADSIYEVIPVYQNKIFRLSEHLTRLTQSAKAIELSNESTAQNWSSILYQLLKHNQELGPNQSIYLQISRGAAAMRSHAFDNTLSPTIFAMSSAFQPPTIQSLRTGISAITCEDIRWQACYIKSTALLGNVLMYNRALNQGAKEAILVRDGKVMEGSSSNVFIVKNHKVITPPKSDLILGGITRDLILELAKQHQIPYEERNIAVDELAVADEIWITSSTREIAPVVELNNRSVGDGSAGTIWHAMIQHFQHYIEKL